MVFVTEIGPILCAEGVKSFYGDNQPWLRVEAEKVRVREIRIYTPVNQCKHITSQFLFIESLSVQYPDNTIEIYIES